MTKTTILELGPYPYIKNVDLENYHSNFGHLTLTDPLPDDIHTAQKEYFKTIDLNDPKWDTEKIKPFLEKIKPHITGASFDDWESWLREMMGECSLKQRPEDFYYPYSRRGTDILINKHADGNVWGEHPDWERSDWKYEVSNGDTNLGVLGLGIAQN